MDDNYFLLKSGEISQSIISFIRNTRNKYNIPKDKLVLYVDLLSKDIEYLDVFIVNWENIIKKSNIGNLKEIECIYES